MANKEASISVKLVADLRNYVTGIKASQKETNNFAKNVQTDLSGVSSSISDLANGNIKALPGLFTGATTAAGGFAKGLTGVKAALIATGIGAIIVALGTAIGAVTQYFRETEEGAIVWKKTMNTIKAYTEPVLGIIEALGKSIVMLLKGDFKGAWDNIKTAVAGVGEEYKKNAQLLKEVNAITEVMDKKTRESKREIAKLEREIADLKNKANDEEKYNAQQRQSFINAAIGKTKQLYGIEREINQMEFDYAKKRAEMGDDDIETNNNLNDLQIRKDELYAEQDEKLKRMLETQQRINKEVKVQKAEQEAIAAAQAAYNSYEYKRISTRTDNTQVTTSQVDTKTLGDMGAILDANAYKARLLGEEIASTMSQGDQVAFMAQQFGILGSAIGGTTGSFLQMASTLLNLIPQLISQLAALIGKQAGLAIASGVAASQSVPFPLNLISLASTITAIVSALATKPPKLAKGGIAYGDTLARVGEYAGARANPEVIAPLDKLKGIIGGAGGGVQLLQPVVNFDGESMYIMLKRVEDKRRKRT